MSFTKIKSKKPCGIVGMSFYTHAEAENRFRLCKKNISNYISTEEDCFLIHIPGLVGLSRNMKWILR